MGCAAEKGGGEEEACAAAGSPEASDAASGSSNEDEAAGGNPVEGVSPEEDTFREVQEVVDSTYAVEADRIL